jgi:hypothetical protein
MEGGVAAYDTVRQLARTLDSLAATLPDTGVRPFDPELAGICRRVARTIRTALPTVGYAEPPAATGRLAM